MAIFIPFKLIKVAQLENKGGPLVLFSAIVHTDEDIDPKKKHGKLQ